MDPTVILFFVVASALSSGVIAFAFWYGKKREAERKAWAESKGWRYDKRGSTTVISGDYDGVPFEYKVRRQRSGNSTKTIYSWETAAEPADHVVLVGPPIPSAMLAMGLGGSIVQLVLRMVLGPDAEQLADVRELPFGTTLFDGKLTILGDDEAFAEGFFVEGTVAKLRELSQSKMTTAIIRWNARLEVRPMEFSGREADIEALVKLGVQLSRGAGF